MIYFKYLDGNVKSINKSILTISDYSKHHYINPYYDLYSNPIIQNQDIFSSSKMKYFKTITNTTPNKFNKYAKSLINTKNDYMVKLY